jgi:protocatechuate 3,4-dioxygenase beta subunit
MTMFQGGKCMTFPNDTGSPSASAILTPEYSAGSLVSGRPDTRPSRRGSPESLLPSMTTEFTEESATTTVIDSFENCSDDRLTAVLRGIVKYLHGFICEIEPTQQEWNRGIEFLTEVGRLSDGPRQEFTLLSDVLGASMLVDAINNRKSPGATESTVLGPFHIDDSPARELGADIALTGYAPRCVVRGTLRSTDGRPLPGAQLDVWQADDAGCYDTQQPDQVPEHNLRGLFTANTAGEFWFRTIVPRYYPIPDDGPVGRLLRASNRHPNRPAHIHFIGSAEGFAPVVTHVFVEGSPFLDDDAVFGVKKSLIREVQRFDDPALARRYGVANPFGLIEFDVVLDPILPRLAPQMAGPTRAPGSHEQPDGHAHSGRSFGRGKDILS